MLLKYRDDDLTFLAVMLPSVELLLEGRGLKNLKHTPKIKSSQGRELSQFLLPNYGTICNYRLDRNFHRLFLKATLKPLAFNTLGDFDTFNVLLHHALLYLFICDAQHFVAYMFLKVL